ncbi:hypothetical protein DY000_02040151 [Brassica cretica]|uniref:Uncharacterized protein n=1 Tax=Brassica cretica TaxID=69181 RepID=A0ABQ7BHU7_BRACR|nr:hypothetical protein DY000_02040151 [Brassica cretica]
MLSPPSGLEYRDFIVRAGGACEPAHHQQQDCHASAEATPRRPPTRLLMRTNPLICIPIYLYFLLFSANLADGYSQCDELDRYTAASA